MLSRKPAANIIPGVISFLKGRYGELSYHLYPNITGDYELPFTTQATIQYEGRSIDGWGTGASQDEASFKAVMELLERVVFFTYSPYVLRQESLLRRSEYTISEIEQRYPQASNWIWQTTSGLSLHTDKKKAKEFSIAEIIERHTILHSLLTGIKPQKVEAPSIVQDYKVPEQFEMDFFELRGPLAHYVAISRLKTPLGPYFGFGSSKDRRLALEKAFSELSPRIIHAFEQLHKTDKTYSPHFEKPQDYFEGNSNPVRVIGEKVAQKDIYTVTESVSSLFSEVEGLYMCRAISPCFLSMFQGAWNEETINVFALDGYEYKIPDYEHFVG